MKLWEWVPFGVGMRLAFPPVEAVKSAISKFCNKEQK